MTRLSLAGGFRWWPWIVLGAVVLAAAVGVTIYRTTSVGVVDAQRLLNESLRALSYQKQLDDREKVMAADLRLLSNALSKDDLEARRTAYRSELAKMKQGLEDQLNAEIRKIVAGVARRRRLRVVLVRQSVTQGGIDVTADVIEGLR